MKMFATRDKAKRFAEKVGGEVYYFGPRSKTRLNYKIELENREGYFDEEVAASFPYIVSWLKEKSSSS